MKLSGSGPAKAIFSRQDGFVLVTVTLLGSILFAGAVSYMSTISNQTHITRASNNQLSAQSIAEAGIEEAAWELAYNNASFSSSDGWAISGSDKIKTVSSFTDADGNEVGSYTTTVTDWASNTPLISVVGTASAGGASNTVTIKASMSPRSAYTSAATTHEAIVLSDNVMVDSYSSDSGAYGGDNITDNAGLNTNSTASGAITLSDHVEVNGNAGVGSGGTIDILDSATLSGTTSAGVINTLVSNTVPSALSSLVSLGSLVLGGNSSQTITTGNYKYTDITTSDNATVTISGNVSLYLTGTTSLSSTGNSGININSGSSLTVYVDGSVALSASGFANDNGSANPGSFQLHGTPSATSVAISGNGDISGIINTPQADVSISGNNDFYGSIIANSLTASGNANIHYDEALPLSGPSPIYKLLWTRRTS